MVVFIHSYSEEFVYQGNEVILATAPWVDWMKYIISKIISDCAVPGYFFLSGMLLFRKDVRWKDNIMKKMRTLMIPYLLLNTIWIGAFYVAQHIGALHSLFSGARKFIAEWTWKDWVRAYTVYSDISTSPFVSPLWFMRDLFLMNLLAPVLKKVIDRAPRLMVLVLLGTVVFADNVGYLFLRQYALISFCLGYYAVKYDWRFRDIDNLSPLLLTVAYLVAIVLTCFARGSRFYLAANTMNVLTGLLFFARCTSNIKDPVWRGRLLRLSRYGVPVYLFQERTLGLMKKVAARFLPVTAVSNILQYFGVMFLTIFLCIILAKLMERFTPRLYSVLTGGR